MAARTLPFGLRVALVVAAASLVPLGLLAVGATRSSTAVVAAKVVELQSLSTQSLARYVDTWTQLHLQLVEAQLAAFRLDELNPAERQGFARLALQQVPDVLAVAVVDKSGQQAATVVADLEMRDAWSEEARLLIAAAAPGVAQTAPARRSARGPVLPAVALQGDWGVAVLFDLTPVAAEVAANTGPQRDAALLGPDGGLLAGGEQGLIEPARLEPLGRSLAADNVRYALPSGTSVVAAAQPIPTLEWLVVVAEPVTSAEAAARDIRRRSLFFAVWAALLSAVLGWLVSRSVTKPVLQLKAAAQRVTAGALGQTVPEGSADELGQLNRAFNEMSRTLADNEGELRQKNAEIEAFNEELQDRVEERTQELRDAQAQLVHSARLAAVGELGAGLAHELNNPLAGVLGLVQVLRAGGPPKGTLLDQLETQAQRCAEVARRLIRLADPPQTPDARERLDAVALMAAVAELVQTQFAQRDVRLVVEPEVPVWIEAERDPLVQALTQVLASVRAASARGAELRIRGSASPHGLELHLSEAAASSDDFRASGMGLWVAQQVLAAHGGRLSVPTLHARESAVWLLLLPPAP